MSYLDTLDKLRREVFSEPSTKPKQTTGFIPIRSSAPAEDSRDIADRPKEWLKAIKQASEEAKKSAPKSGGSFASGLLGSLVKPKKEEQPEVTKAANKEAFIARRGDTPSTYSPDAPSGPAAQRVSFGDDWDNVAQAVKDIESGGGNYAARGPMVRKGNYKGERAMGAYQVMPGNLPQWSLAALGREVSEEEFMASESIQDAIFIDQMRKAKDKYGTIEDAVSVWFSGRPLAQAGNASDDYLTVPEYVNKFQGRYNTYRNS